MPTDDRPEEIQGACAAMPSSYNHPRVTFFDFEHAFHLVGFKPMCLWPWPKDFVSNRVSRQMVMQNLTLDDR